jgi:hypothetical protein
MDYWKEFTRGCRTFGEIQARVAARRTPRPAPAPSAEDTARRLDEAMAELGGALGYGETAAAELARGRAWSRPRPVAALHESAQPATEDLVELDERTGLRGRILPRPPATKQPAAPREVELREPADPTKALEESFRSLGLSESAAAIAARGH